MTMGGKLGGLGLGGVVLLIAAAAGCDGGDVMPMSGRLVLSGRDVGNLFFWKERTLGFTRAAADPSQPEPEDFWILPLDEATPSRALAGVRWDWPDSWPLWVAGDLLLTGSQLERAYDLGTRQEANLFRDFPFTPGGNGATGEISLRSLLDLTAMRSDGQALARLLTGVPQTVVVGRPPELRAYTLPDGASVGNVIFVGTDLALLIRQTTAAGDVVGVHRLDTSTGTLAPLAAPTAAEQWTGITGFCDEVEPTEPCGFFATVGCSVGEPACPDGKPVPCLLLYSKVDPDDAAKTATYVHDVNAGTSRRLAGTDTDGFFADGRNHLLVWGSSTDPVTRYWNMCTDVQRECPFSVNQVAWRPDGGAFAVYGSTDSLRIVDVAGGTCVQPDLPGSGVFQAQYSSGSDRLWWIAAADPERTTHTLWLADAGAQSPVAITSGPFIGASFTPDGQHLYVSHLAESTSALGWVDVNAATPTEVILSTNYGDVGVLGNRRALFVDHFNAQDGNGELVLVEPAAGASRTLARGVTTVAVPGRSDAEGTDVGYAVRGRAGSSRDGLWLTTLPP
jgi:hypothetical protein